MKEYSMQHVIFERNKNYLVDYYLISLTRMLKLTCIIFIFQFLISINLKSLLPVYPLYPPIGIAYVMFYLFGWNALLGLVLGEGLAYFLNGYPIFFNIYFLMSDLIFSALLCQFTQNTFSSDIHPFQHKAETLRFFILTCLVMFFSTLLKKIATGFDYLNFLNVWLSSINAILLFSMFILSWVFVPFSREKIVNIRNKIEKKYFIAGILGLLVFIGASIYFIKNIPYIYLLLLGMFVSIGLNYRYGYLLGSFLLFIMGTFYLAHFMVFQDYYINNLGISLYSLAPCILLIVILCILGGFVRRRSSI